jgi:hypothetical protein
MITTPTVLVLGAGASAAYGFNTGWELLQQARAFTVDTVAGYIQPISKTVAPALHDALLNTGELSIDAMLESETRPEVVKAGKALMARFLLRSEAHALQRNHAFPREWYRVLFGALSAPTEKEALAQPFTVVTFNYDRSLERCLAQAWRVKYHHDRPVDPDALSAKFIHVHGQLGALLETGGAGTQLPYGGGEDGITDADVLEASQGIKVIHEANTDDPKFVAARKALTLAGQQGRVVFLGFAFAQRNFERLQLSEHMPNNGSTVYVSAFGFSENGMRLRIQKPFESVKAGLVVGNPRLDAADFLHEYPQALV